MYALYLNVKLTLHDFRGEQMSKKEEHIQKQNTASDNPPSLSEKQDKNINYSDTSPIDETKHWYKAVEHPAVYRPIKKPTTIRLDADVLEWLKSKGKGYQTRINKILREAMLDEIQR